MEWSIGMSVWMLIPGGRWRSVCHVSCMWSAIYTDLKTLYLPLATFTSHYCSCTPLSSCSPQSSSPLHPLTAMASQPQEQLTYITTVTHPEILHNICPYLDTPTIKALRLASHSVNDVATPYLFRCITLSIHKRRLARLEWIAEQPKFAKGVREIVWETAHYSDPDPQINMDVFKRTMEGEPRGILSRMPLSRDFEARWRQQERMIQKYRRLATEEEALGRTDLVETLSQSFRKLQNLKSLVMTVWNREADDTGAYCPWSVVYACFVSFDSRSCVC